VRGTETFEAAANSFCRLLRNWPKAVFLGRLVATDLAGQIGHEAGLAEYLDQLTPVAAEENDAVDENRSPRMSELPNPFRLLLFATDHRRAADTRFFRGRGLLPTEWSAGFLRAPKTFDLSRWLPPVPDWEHNADLWVATPVVVSYLPDSLRNEYSSAWQVVYSEYYCNLIAAWVRTLQEDKVFVRLHEKTLRHFDVLDTSKLRQAPDVEPAHALYGKMRRAVERADGRGVESALAILGQAVARAVDGDANYKRFSQHLEAVQPEEAVAPTRFNSQSVLGRRVHAYGGPSGGDPPSARNTRARSVSQESGARVASRHLCRRDSSRSNEEEEE